MTAWTDVIGWTLVHFLWEGTVVALVCAGLLRVLRQASAHVRYVVACAGLLAALTAPPVTVVVLTSGSPAWTGAAAEGVSPVVSVHTSSPGVQQVATASVAGVRSVPVDNDTVAALLSAFVAFWAAGVVLLTARLASGWWRVRRLHVEALAAPASNWLAAATHIAGKLGLSRAIHVADSLHVDTPTVIGWLRPVVLLPVAALANLTPAQVQAILAHELAHIRRHDFIVNLLQTVAEVVLFYHPAVWWLSARIRVEREHCCDDIAVDVCGDPVGYAEALTALAAWGRMRLAEDHAAVAASSLAVAATGGSLLYRVRRLLRLPDERGRRPVTSFVVATTVLLVLLVGTRLVIVAQTPPPEARAHHTEARLGPPDINRLLGFDLFPGPAHYATDDPRDARAWDVKVAFPGGEMAFMGFTARSVVRYAYALDGDAPVVDGPSWLDHESRTIRGETSAEHPGDEDFRAALRVTLERDYGISIRRDARLFPVYGLQVAEKGRLGPNIRPSETECFDAGRDRLDTIGPTLFARGQQMQFCGVGHTISGPKGYRATMADIARSLRGFNMGPVNPGVPEREIIDQTGLTGVYDFELDLGFLPLAAIASVHPTLAVGFGPAIRTFPQALEEQLGLRLVPSDAPRDVAVIVTAQRQLQARGAQAERTLRSVGANQAN